MQDIILMILKMSAVTALYVLLIVILKLWTNGKKLNPPMKLFIGIIFGLSSVLSTHYGIAFEGMIINVRDLGPLSAGLFFSPASGIIAGLIGGIERYIAGAYFNVGSYTKVACAVSTCLAGFVALFMNLKIFKGKSPSPVYALFMGAIMEVFHMYVVFATHRDDMRMAFLVVKICSFPMILYTGLGLAIAAAIVQVITGEWRNPFVKRAPEAISVSQKFQRWLFAITVLVMASSFVTAYYIDTETSYQMSVDTLESSITHIKEHVELGEGDITPESKVSYDVIVTGDGYIKNGEHKGRHVDTESLDHVKNSLNSFQDTTYFDEDVLILSQMLADSNILTVYLTDESIYWNRDAQAYENCLSSILLSAILYVIIAFLVNYIVVDNITKINVSLERITGGNLNEIVKVRSSSEFALLSDDINETVDALKGYTEAEKKRMAQELTMAATIQDSSLPKVFTFQDRDDVEIFATMKPAKEVGGDFYDFFFVDSNTLALVIADVSGKGIPASLFMMRSKTAIRNLAIEGGSPGEIIEKTNKQLCDGNDAEMFVTAWIGLFNLSTGVMTCANAGHEYPVIKRADGDYELFKDKHSIALAAMEMLKAREYEITFNPGDKLFVYSDGIPEAINDNVEQYGTDRMLKALNEVKDKSVTETLPHITESINAFKGNAEQFDDMTMLAIEFIHYCT
jgi:serine phosphatase RsbU (regulator of sigma subunit)